MDRAVDLEARGALNTPAAGATAYLLRDWCTASEEEYLVGRVYRGSEKRWTEVSGRRLQSHGGVVHRKGMIPVKFPEWMVSEIAKVRRSVGDLLPAEINHVLVNEYPPGDGILPHQDGDLYYPAVAIVSLNCDAVMRFSPHEGLNAPRDAAFGEVFGETASASRNESSSSEYVEDANANSKTNSKTKTKTNSKDSFGVFLPRRSLLVFTGSLYERYLHGIDAVAADVIDETVVNGADVFSRGEREGKEISRSDGVGGETISVPRDRVRISMTFRNVLKVRKALRLF